MTLEQRVEFLEGLVLQLREEVTRLRSGLCVENPAIPNDTMRMCQAFRMDHRQRSAWSAGFPEWGGNPKYYGPGGAIYMTVNDTGDLGFGYSAHDLATGQEGRRPKFGDALAYIYGFRFIGWPPRAEGRSSVIALLHGGVDIRAAADPGGSDPATAVPKSVATFTAPVAFANSYRGCGWHMHFDEGAAKVKLGRMSEIPQDAFGLYVTRP